ncbi:cell envelope integrity EipB family protein [Pararhodospirillum oryzae]|nr:cell envelope integrity EipB family protein [Pararhodospirillum oryzae]
MVMKTQTAILLAGTLVLGIGTPLLEAEAATKRVHLVPHEAQYALSLARTRPGGVVGARGQMNYKLESTCSGWTMETRTTLTLSYAEGADVDTVWEFVAFEARDGSNYSFFIRNTHNGAVDDVLEGGATLTGSPATGTARFKRPSIDPVPLPAGTLFPNAHTLAILEAARKGQHFVSRTLFDGGSKEGPTLVTAVIGRPMAAPPRAAGQDPLLRTPSWRMAIAFFPPEVDGAAPEDNAIPTYEVDVRYHDNGIAQDMVQDFGSFSLASKLTGLHRLPEPDC